MAEKNGEGLVAFQIKGNRVAFKSSLKDVPITIIPTLIVVMELYIDDLKKIFDKNRITDGSSGNN